MLFGDFLTVKVGDKAPDFTLPSQMGDNVTLSEFLGKKKDSPLLLSERRNRGLHKRSMQFPRQL